MSNASKPAGGGSSFANFSVSPGGVIGPRGYAPTPPGARGRPRDPVFNLKTSTSHKVRDFGDFKYWAQGGRIHIVNEVDGAYKSCSIDEFGQRALTLAASAMNAVDAQERRMLTKIVGDMRDVLYEAKSQGDPHDPKVLEQRLRQRRPKAKLGYAKANHFAESGPLAGDDYFPTAVVGKSRPLYEAE